MTSIEICLIKYNSSIAKSTKLNNFEMFNFIQKSLKLKKVVLRIVKMTKVTFDQEYILFFGII